MSPLQRITNDRVRREENLSIMREFSTGATRDSDTTKIDPEGFLSPLVIQRYCDYLNKHRKQADGKIRDSDNWQAGIPLDVYMKSMWRHFLDVWTKHRGNEGDESYTIEDSLCAVIFNAMGYLHECRRTDNKFIEFLDEHGIPVETL